MKRSPTFRITQDDIDELRDQTQDLKLVIEYERWIERSGKLNKLVLRIEDAFEGQSLGDGTGLLEANGIDDYAGTDELSKLRSCDEQTDWRRIQTESLNRYYAAPSFLDARGFVFHLPAFLIAELNDKLNFGFIDHMIDSDPISIEWMDLLTPPQRDVLVDTLRLIIHHPEYSYKSDRIKIAIERLRGDRQRL